MFNYKNVQFLVSENCSEHFELLKLFNFSSSEEGKYKYGWERVRLWT